MAYPLWKNLSFSTFSTSCFYCVESLLLDLEYHTKNIFLAHIALKKIYGKLGNFGPEPWNNPFGKILVFRLFQLLVFIT